MEALLSNVDWPEIGIASWDTLIMVGLSLLFSVLAGLPIGVLLFLTGKRQLLEQPVAYAVLSFVVNVLRSVPFIILLIVMIPFTVMLIGTSLGVAGAIPPLVAGGAPFFARLVETSLRKLTEVLSKPPRLWAPTCGRSYSPAPRLPEALPGIIAGITVTAITLVSYAGDVWRYRRRRPGRLGNSLWLSTVSDR